MPRNPQTEEPEPEPDPDLEGRRHDLPWRVVQGIEPDEDVLSRLVVEDESGRPIASLPTVGPERDAGLERRVVLEAARSPERPITPDPRTVSEHPVAFEQPVLPEWHGMVARPADEVRPAGTAQPSAPWPRRLRPLLMSAILVAAVALVAWSVAGGRWPLSIFASRANGTLVIESRPPGVPVTVDGTARGHTPVSVTLEPGRHTFVLTGRAPRERVVTIERGARVYQYFEMPEPPAGGTLHVETNVRGAQVSVDGTPRGITPLDMAGLEPGPHVVMLRQGTAAVTQHIIVQAGDALSLVVPLATADATSPGSVRITSPIELHLYEGEQLVGISRADRVLMLPGRHDLRMVNVALGFETTRSVQITPNKITTLTVQPPNGVLHVNAVPWAEVFMDGNKIGDTPIANYSAALGSHEIVLRNPRFAERRLIVTVTLTTPARVGVDLQK